MKRKIFTKEELETVFRINEKCELERLNAKYSPKGEGWTVVDCKVNSHGYRQVRLNDSKIYYHTIVWILINGTIEDAEAVLDHLDGDKLNNRIDNLRLTTQRENSQNKESHRAGRLQGCYFRKDCNKWQVQIKINSNQINLGYCNTEQEAHNVYCKACELINEYINNEQFRNLVNCSNTK